MMEIILINIIQALLFTPIAGMINMGNINATPVPDIITAEILLNTDNEPLALTSLVDRGTIKLWLILYIVKAIE